MDGGCPLLLLDTNIVLDWLAFDDAAARPISAAITAREVRLISSPAGVAELQRALAYKAIGLDAPAQAQVLEVFLRHALLRDDPPEGASAMLPRCDDRDDQKFLELAWHAGARWLVSRDKALLKLAAQVARMGRFGIIAPPGFSAALAARGSSAA